MEETGTAPILWYFADPMCSWCWGFSPVITRARHEYGDRLRFSLNLGGLRPGTTEPMSDSMREEILHHWHEVHRLSGQPFRFDGALPAGFVYDTEPASRAVLAFGRSRAAGVLDFFSVVQAAFYQYGQDVTRADVLAKLATESGLDTEEFLALFDSDEMRKLTQQHFIRTRKAGVRGFPTVVWQQGEVVELVSNGYVPYATLAGEIDARLTATLPVN